MASTMTRSRTQVLRGFLPGQTFQHQNEVVVKVRAVPSVRSEVNKDILLESLDRQLATWRRPDGTSATSGFILPVLDHPDRYVPMEPDGQVYYVPWPLVMRCRNRQCEAAVVFETEDEWNEQVKKGRNPARCHICKTAREQFPYMIVHSCGRDGRIVMPSCNHKDASGREHGRRHVYLRDTRSFETASWRCRHDSCRNRYIEGMRYVPCSCGNGPFRHVTVRQDLRFITHTFPFVSFDLTPMQTLRSAPGAEKVVVGSYLEFFTDNYQQALEEVGRDRAEAEKKWARIEPMLDDVEKAEWRRTIFGETGGAFDEIDALVGDNAAVMLAGSEQCARERTLVWSGQHVTVKRLRKLREAAQASGRTGMLQILTDAEQALPDFGVSDLLLVEDFPVALAAYGYTRIGRNPANALLRSFPPLSSGRHRGKTPIYCSRTDTEAVFFELDAERVIAWLHANGAIAAQPALPRRGDDAAMKARRQHAKGWLLAQQLSRPDTVGRHVYLLEHTFAHALIKALAGRSGFGEDTMSEYIIPNMLTVGIYADTHQEFTLGALIWLVENRLKEWLESARDSADQCEWDPHCHNEDGACMSCLHLAFGCGSFNRDLDRAALLAAPSPGPVRVTHGFWEWLPPLS